MAQEQPVDPQPLSLANALGVSAEARVHTVDAKPLSKAEQALLQSNAIDLEMHDQFVEMYGEENKVRAIKPPYIPSQLDALVTQNNTLSQCVAAYVVNIDGTGYDIVPEDETDDTEREEDTNIDAIKSFFDNPYPNMTFTQFRKKVRTNLERTGNAYIEVIRNQKEELVFLNVVPSVSTRLIQLDDPVPVTVEVERMGVRQTVKIMKRERRFVQSVGKKFVYFKEFGASRELDKTTGKWAGEGQEMVAGQEATELIHLTVDKDTMTPYGVPRWINQVPSILGSRRAEEFNLDFFNHGGLPPAIIFLQGASMNDENATKLTNYLSGKAKFKQRAVVVSTYSSEGQVGTSTAGSKVTVERFGSERQADSMFENYDQRCGLRVRGAFRLPPMFLGLNEDYNFATAQTAYMVAEAQVFQPERTEFDEVINLYFMPLIKEGYMFKSNQLSVKDVERQLKGLELAKDQVERESFVDTMNEVTGLDLVAKEVEDVPVPPTPLPPGVVAQDDVDEDGNPIMKADPEVLVELAEDWAAHLSGDASFTPETISGMESLIKALPGPTRKLFNGFVAARLLPSVERDADGLRDIMGCVSDALQQSEM